MIKKPSKTGIPVNLNASNEAPTPTPTPTLAIAPEDFIGQRIQDLRISKNLNHDGLSRITKFIDKIEGKGINRTTIRGYEVGMYKPGARELRLLSEALEVSPSWLLLGTGDAAPVNPDIKYLAANRQNELEKLIRVVFLLPSIDKKSRDTIYDLVITMARMSLGEEKFRAEDAMLREMASMFCDCLEDYKRDKVMPDMEQLKPLMEKYMGMVADKVNTFSEQD